jgi:hypothetical protein
VVSASPYADNHVVGRTVETDNAGRVTTYCYNTSGQVIQTWRPWDTTAPTITGAPNPFVFQDGYTNGVTPFVVGLSADDTPSGIKRVALEEVGHGELTSATSPCAPATTMPSLCPASFSSPVTINPTPLSEGAHVIRQTATDLAGNVATSATWAINVDRTAPGAPAGPDATVDASGTAVVSWYPSQDPALPDGTPGSGTTGYSVRYRVGSGTWQGPTVTTVPSFQVPGATVGQSATLEITPGDAVGNIGAMFSTSVTFAASTDPCTTTPRPDVCTDPTDGSPVDAEEDPDIDIDGNSSGGQALTPATLFHLRSHDSGCATSRCWATIRSKPQSWAIGNVRLEYPGAAANVAVTSTLRRISSSNHWHLGSLSDYSNHCAWVSGTLLAGGSPSTSGCDDPTFGPEFWQWQSIPYSTPADRMPNGTNVRGNNCFNKSGTYRRPGKNTCDRGTAVFLTGPTVECANVYVVPDGTSTSSQCAQKDIVRNLNTSSEWGNYCVSWRYVTRDRQWVLVRDQRAINRGGWVYIRTSALPAQRTQWHAYDDDDWASCPPNSN